MGSFRVYSERKRRGITQLQFLDECALVADPREVLNRLVPEFKKVLNRKTFKINVGKNKVMRCST